MDAEQIVRQLAGDMPTSWSGDGWWHECACCHKGLALDGNPSTHAADCVYIAAYLWTRAHDHHHL